MSPVSRIFIGHRPRIRSPLRSAIIPRLSIKVLKIAREPAIVTCCQREKAQNHARLNVHFRPISMARPFNLISGSFAHARSTTTGSFERPRRDNAADATRRDTVLLSERFRLFPLCLSLSFSLSLSLSLSLSPPLSSFLDGRERC